MFVLMSAAYLRGNLLSRSQICSKSASQLAYSIDLIVPLCAAPGCCFEAGHPLALPESMQQLTLSQGYSNIIPAYLQVRAPLLGPRKFLNELHGRLGTHKLYDHTGAMELFQTSFLHSPLTILMICRLSHSSA